MLKHSVVLAFVASCLAAVALGTTFTADKDFVYRQKVVYELFWLREDPRTSFPELWTTGQNYDITDVKCYTKENVVEEFMKYYKHGMLPRNAIFSVFYREHLDEVVALFNLFYYAKDFDTFYKTAAWARVHVNRGLYLYTLGVAVIHRPDTKFIRIMPFYEMNPHLFFRTEVFPPSVRALREIETEKTGSKVVTVRVNHTDWYVEDNEYKLNYFREDGVLNNWYRVTQYDFPFWMPAKEFGLQADVRGEVFLFDYRMNYARYYMERLSHDVGDVEDINWDKGVRTAYYPFMAYENGMPFPQRIKYAKFPSHMHPYITKLKAYEERISMAIDSGYAVSHDGKYVNLYGPGGFEFFGNILEGNADSVNKDFYGNYAYIARYVLGFSPKPINKYKVLPSALQHYATSSRDPAYWSIVKKFVGFYDQYAAKLPKYTVDELKFDGVKIESVDVDSLVTRFDTYDYFMSIVEKGKVYVSQYRLNHDPFTFTINVNSDKDVKAQITGFYGPKYDIYGREFDIAQSYKYFVIFDEWTVDLKTGTNNIVRKSADNAMVGDMDEVPGDVFYQSIYDAYEDKQKFKYSDSTYEYPGRYLLPKGTAHGLPLQFFFYVSPVVPAQTKVIKSRAWGDWSYRIRLGFPLDRPPCTEIFTVPNSHFKDFFVYHKE